MCLTAWAYPWSSTHGGVTNTQGFYVHANLHQPSGNTARQGLYITPTPTNVMQTSWPALAPTNAHKRPHKRHGLGPLKVYTESPHTLLLPRCLPSPPHRPPPFEVGIMMVEPTYHLLTGNSRASALFCPWHLCQPP